MSALPTRAALTCLLVAAAARAETTSTRLTPEKPGDHLYTFTVKVERLEDGDGPEYLQFHVTVQPRPGKGPWLPRQRGTLEVYAGKEFVSSCEVRPGGTRRKRTYTFRVAPKVAGGSKFVFAETDDMRNGFYYWFVLGDFVRRK